MTDFDKAASDQTRRQEAMEEVLRETRKIPIEDLKRDRLITLKSVAKILGVCKKTAKSRLTAGHFRFVREGGSIRVWENSVYEYLQRLTAVSELETGFIEDLWKNGEK
jgi:hypothetical protein